MNKCKATGHNFFLIAFFFNSIFLPHAIGQNTSTINKPFLLQVQLVGKDSGFNVATLQLQQTFDNVLQCTAYINNLPNLLSAKGYPAASVDSVWQDTASATIQLYLGKQYKWIKLLPDSIDQKAIDQSGYLSKNFSNKLFSMPQLQGIQNKILNYYENNGYPFAQVFLDSIHLDEEKINALLKVKKGYLYLIDSIRIFGKAKISKNFLSRYLGIYDGSIYNKEQLDQVSKKILELPYVRETQSGNIVMLGGGSILNLYLAPKKSSQFNFLVGLTPATNLTNQFQLTPDVNLNLKNTLTKGETIVFSWQQLQPQSPRINLGYTQPYIFNSNFGVDFLFNLFKKDSSFVQVNGQLGLQYILSANQLGKFFVQWQSCYLLQNGVDTNQIIASHQLPVNIDVSATNFGIDYNLIKTDYRLNPRRGNEVSFTTTIGIKNIKQNSTILSIKDPSFNYASLYDSLKLRTYQFKIKAGLAHYFPLGKQTTLKTALNVGVYSSPAVFRNELFQIGGFKLLRGFDEESIYATQYAVSTAEYRIRSSLNSYFFGFVDAGWVKTKYDNYNVSNNFISSGIGMALETKVGLLNISYAIGKRSDVPFNLSQASKIHLGYVNYF